MTQHQKQPYDSSLKAFFREQTAEILKYIVPDAELVGELNTEVLKPQPPLRADKVYQVLYRGEPHVLHLELETGANSRMAYRMLIYHALLLEEHKLPVVSMIIYPFHDSIVRSPLREMSGQQEILTFHFKTLLLYELDAQQYIRDHIVTMYPLLPTMRGADAPVLLQAIDELKEQYKDQQLSRRLIWFRTLLERVKTIPLQDKVRVTKELSMFDELLEKDPYIQEREERAAERAEVQTWHRAVLYVVQARFPNLVEIAEPRVTQLNKPDALDLLAKQIATAPDEAFARTLLNGLAA